MADLEKKYADIEQKISAMSQQCEALSEQIKSDIDNRQKDTAAAKSAVDEAVKVLTDCKKMRDEADDILLRIQQKEKGIVQTTAADETEAYVKTMYDEIKKKGVDKYEFSKKEGLTMTTGVGWVTPVTPEPLFKLPTPQPSILDILRIIVVDGTEVNINKETGFENNAAFIAEGKEKPLSNLTTENQLVSLDALAHIVAFTKKLLINGKDELIQELIDKLVWGSRKKLASEVIAGDGTVDDDTGIMHLNGLLNNATAFNNVNAAAINTYTTADKLLLASLQVQMGGFTPDAIIMNPADYTALRLQKDDVGRYLFDNPVSGNGIRTIWDLPVVSELGMPMGQFIVADLARYVRLYRSRDGVEVKMLTEHKDWASRNLVGIRVEEYLGLGIINNAAIVKGDYTPANGGNNGDNGGGDTPDTPAGG